MDRADVGSSMSFTDAEVFGNDAQSAPVPTIAPATSGVGGMSDADVFGPQSTSPPASASASTPAGLTDDQVFNTSQPQDHYSVTRGIVTGIGQQQPQLYGQTLEGLSLLAPDHFKEPLQTGANYLKDVKTPEDYQLIAPKLRDIKGFGDAATWAGETFGTGAASTAAPIAAGVAGYAVGGPIGAGIGAFAGSAAPNYGEVFQDLKAAGVEPTRAAKLSAMVLPIMSGLDMAGLIPGGKLLATGGKELVKQGLIKRIAIEAGKSAAAEGVTEGAQEAVKAGLINKETGVKGFTESQAWDILENALGGALVGGPFGAVAAGVSKEAPSSTKKEPPTPEQIIQAFEELKPGQDFNPQQLGLLREIVTRPENTSLDTPATLSPEGGNFTSQIPTTRAAAAVEPEAEKQGPGPLWYSKAEQVAQQYLPESASAQDMRGILVNRGVKLDELTWTGLDDFFSAHGANIQPTQHDLDAPSQGAQAALVQWKQENPGQKPSQDMLQAVQQERQELQKAKGDAARATASAPRITKQDVINHLRDNQYKLKEVIRDDTSNKLLPREEEARQEVATLWLRNQELNTQLDNIPISTNWVTVRQPLLEEWNRNQERLNGLRATLRDAIRKPVVEYGEYTAPGERRGYATIAIQVPFNERAVDALINNTGYVDEEDIRRARGYTPPHFGETTRVNGQEQKVYENTIAHGRITLREDYSGQLVAHVEEFQTDWLQAGRKLGYLSEKLIKETDALQLAQDVAFLNFEELIGIGKSSLDAVTFYDHRLRNAIAAKDAQVVIQTLENVRTTWGDKAHDAFLEYSKALFKNVQHDKILQQAVADAPYKLTEDWTRLLLRRIIRWAADKGIQRITWSNPDLAFQYSAGNNGTATTDPNVDPERAKQYKGMQKYYGEIVPKVARDLARQYGGDFGVTNIRASQYGPWIARPFVANGVVTGWGMGRWEGNELNYAPTQGFKNFFTGPDQRSALPNSFKTSTEAISYIDILKKRGVLTDANSLKYSNQVGYIEFDRRAQWNFQSQGMPRFMADPTMEPAEVQPKSPQFEVFETTDLRNIPPEARSTSHRAALKFGDVLEQFAKRFNFKGKINFAIHGTPAQMAKAPGGLASLATHIYIPKTRTHTIEVDLSRFDMPADIAGARAATFLWGVLTHEFGHAVMDEHFDALPTSTKLAIRGAYDKFLSDAQQVRGFTEKMGLRMSSVYALYTKEGFRQKDWNALPQAEREYWVGFDEWFADQVSRWATTDEQPLSIVDRALKGIADMLKALMTYAQALFGGLSFTASEPMTDWLNSFLTTQAGFGHPQYLELDSNLVKTDQRAVAAEEPDMFIPERSPAADTMRAAAAMGAPGSPGPASSAVHASRINRFYKYMAGLEQLAQANPFFAPLIRYVERMKRMQLDETQIHDAAIRVRKDWKALGTQGENLTAFINDLVNLDFMTPQEKARGVVRHPNQMEQQALVAKHQLSKEGLEVFRKIKVLNDEVLKLVSQSAMQTAMRVITDPVKLANKIDEINIRTQSMMSRPFFPFMRFGRHYVIQKDAAGNTVHFETFERVGFKSAERQQQTRVDDLRKQFPGYPDPDVGILPEAASPFIGLPPMLLEEIRDKLNLTPSQIDALENLMYNHSTATKFPKAFKQNYTKGYSFDFQRSFARYFFHLGRYYARSRHSWELNDDIRAARLVGGNNAHKIADFMSDHLKNTVLEAKGDFGAVKGGIFLWAMGYVPAAATQNLTQTPMITFPYLAAKFGDVSATRAMAKAMGQLSTFYKRGTYSAAISKGGASFDTVAMSYGIQKGIITESQASELAAASQGMNLMKGLGGNRAQQGWQAFMEKSAWMFEMAEQWNRRIAYRAGLNLALDKPNAPIVKEAINANRGEYDELKSRLGNDAQAAAIITASYVTNQTQFQYARWARPRFMRGRLAGTIFVFKLYMQSTLFMLGNNKSDVLPRYLVMAALMGGMAGIPGFDDLKEILKMVGHRFFGKDWNVDHAVRDFILSHFDGKIPPDMVLGGLARQGYGIPALLDLMGSFVTGTPGRGFDGKVAGQNVPFPVLDRHKAITLGPILPVELGKLFDTTDDPNRVIAEQSQRASGAVFSVGFNMVKAILDNKLEGTDPKRWERAIPRQLADMTRTWRAFSEGRERSRGGPDSAPTIASFNWRDPEQAGELLAMATGYQALRVQSKWDSIMAKAEVEKFYEMQQKTLFGQLFEARKGGNTAEINDVLDSIRRYNRELPQIAKGYTITEQNARSSIQGRERELIARERGVPTQRRNVPISREIDRLFPESTVDVRRVR